MVPPIKSRNPLRFPGICMRIFSFCISLNTVKIREIQRERKTETVMVAGYIKNNIGHFHFHKFRKFKIIKIFWHKLYEILHFRHIRGEKQAIRMWLIMYICNFFYETYLRSKQVKNIKMIIHLLVLINYFFYYFTCMKFFTYYCILYSNLKRIFAVSIIKWCNFCLLNTKTGFSNDINFNVLLLISNFIFA